LSQHISRFKPSLNDPAGVEGSILHSHPFSRKKQISLSDWPTGLDMAVDEHSSTTEAAAGKNRKPCGKNRYADLRNPHPLLP